MRGIHALLAFAVATTLSFGVAGASQANVLTFDGNICNGGQACADYGLIDASYGDVAGVVDVQYNHDVTGGAPGSNLQFWDSAYSDLTNVAWGGNGDCCGTPEILLKPLGGHSVTLNSFDLGSWPNLSRTTQVTIVDGFGNVLGSTGNFTVDGTNHAHVTLIGFTSSNGIGIEWGPSGYNVGIDNVDFTLSGVGVPEPATWAMTILGFGLLGAAVRRRRPQGAVAAA